MYKAEEVLYNAIKQQINTVQQSTNSLITCSANHTCLTCILTKPTWLICDNTVTTNQSEIKVSTA